MNLTTNTSYLFRVMVALSLLLCAIFGGRMYESVCAAAWRLQDSENPITWLWANFTVRMMNLFERDHCKKSARYYAATQGENI